MGHLLYSPYKMKFKSNIYIEVPLKMAAGSSSPRRQNLLHGAKSTESTEPLAGCLFFSLSIQLQTMVRCWKTCGIVLLLGQWIGSQFYHTFLLGSCRFLLYLLTSFYITIFIDWTALTSPHMSYVSIKVNILLFFSVHPPLQWFPSFILGSKLCLHNLYSGRSSISHIGGANPREWWTSL